MYFKRLQRICAAKNPPGAAGDLVGGFSKKKGAVFMYNRKAFKKEAKQLLREVRPHYMLVALVYILLTSGLSSVVTGLTGTGTLLGGGLSIFLNILVTLFGMVLAVGLAGYALRVSRKEQAGVGTLFDGFAFAGRSIGMNILVAIYTFLWCMLAALVFGIVIAAAAFLMDVVMALGIILMVVAYVAMIVVVFAIVLRYAMANFALVENPDAGARAAIRRSVQIMRKNKGKLFVLELSFIGWQLLLGLIALVVLGIGVFVGGMSWVFEEMAMVGENIEGILGMVESLLSQMTLWSILAEIVCWPLAMWLTMYMQVSYAKFYNYVGGYDYHQYMNGGTAVEEPVQAVPLQEAPLVQETSKEAPVQPPVGGYYTPAPDLEAPASEEEPTRDEEN